MYSTGPRTDPWGRPLGTGTQEDLDSPWTTHMERSLRKEASHERRVPETPKDKLILINPCIEYKYVLLLQSTEKKITIFLSVGILEYSPPRVSNQPQNTTNNNNG